MTNYQKRKRDNDLRVYDIYIPELNRYVKFKVLPPEEIKKIMDDISDYDSSEHMKTVVENFVFNMRNEIVDALKLLSDEAGELAIEALFNGCVMLNPGLDIDSWVRIAYSGVKPLSPVDKDAKEIDLARLSKNIEKVKSQAQAKSVGPAKRPARITKTKINRLAKQLRIHIVGQDEAIDSVANVLKRSTAGLNDELRPLGVLLFCRKLWNGQDTSCQGTPLFLIRQGLRYG